MQPTTDILARISRNSLANKDEMFTRLYRYMLRPDLYFVAYKNLYANSGAATKGANDDTADGFSEAKIAKIIQKLADETYQPTPVRRTYIQKKNNPKKKRPLGIPTFTDKLVQEVLRMVLEAVYEPVFLPVSHGFRPKRSCHTALKSLKREFNGMRWFVEGDIKGCFHDTIENNIKFGKPNATMDEIMDAAKKARCHDFIMELPDGYQTIVGEGGSTLSGGEKQRISIARAILKDAPIIILDEATSSVDPENQHLLIEAFDELTRNKTLITIAHRLSTIRNTDQILVVEEGKIVQSGTHNGILCN